MRDLLTTRDRLAADPPPAERTALLERLATFSVVADERCAHLREQLTSVEHLADMIRTEAGVQPPDQGT